MDIALFPPSVSVSLGKKGTEATVDTEKSKPDFVAQIGTHMQVGEMRPSDRSVGFVSPGTDPNLWRNNGPL